MPSKKRRIEHAPIVKLFAARLRGEPVPATLPVPVGLVERDSLRH